MSKRFELKKGDILKVAKNALIFLAPAIFVALADVTKALPEWVSGIWLVVALYLANVITDAFRKWISEHKV